MGEDHVLVTTSHLLIKDELVILSRREDRKEGVEYGLKTTKIMKFPSKTIKNYDFQGISRRKLTRNPSKRIK